MKGNIKLTKQGVAIEIENITSKKEVKELAKDLKRVLDYREFTASAEIYVKDIESSISTVNEDLKVKDSWMDHPYERPNHKLGNKPTRMEVYFSRLRYGDLFIETCKPEFPHLPQTQLQEVHSESNEKCSCINQKDIQRAAFPERRLKATEPTSIQHSVLHFHRIGENYVCKENADLKIPLTPQGKPDMERFAREIAPQTFSDPKK
ncbi:MAG TPA: hypothetical protein VL022_04695 [Moheibacter sp.]|nr:hypothetical protein [Moheibacter sp.]